MNLEIIPSFQKEKNTVVGWKGKAKHGIKRGGNYIRKYLSNRSNNAKILKCLHVLSYINWGAVSFYMVNKGKNIILLMR